MYFVSRATYLTKKANFILKREKVDLNRATGMCITLWIKLFLLGTMMCTKLQADNAFLFKQWLCTSQSQLKKICSKLKNNVNMLLSTDCQPLNSNKLRINNIILLLV